MFRPTVLHPLLPQRAWLDGSVLIVEYQHKVRECDLRTASRIRIRQICAFGWKNPFNFLVVSQRADGKADDEPVRLVLSGPDSWILLTAEQLRLLAQIIGSRSPAPGKGLQKDLRFLNLLADHQQFRVNGPVDWSFRTDPRGLTRKDGNR